VLGSGGQTSAARFHRRPGISVVADAHTAAAHGATAMHDPTEGGIAMGLYELAAASECRLIVDLDMIPVHAHTRRLCEHFGLDPLRLIGSGALLAAVAAEKADALIAALEARRTPVRVIGRAERGRGVEARRNGSRVPFLWSHRDELTKLVDRSGLP
jgi:hydrogenase expression/formation protein HypE